METAIVNRQVRENRICLSYCECGRAIFFDTMDGWCHEKPEFDKDHQATPRLKRKHVAVKSPVK